MIYTRIIERKSKVYVAVEAKNVEEADRIFDEWYDKDTNIENVAAMLSERENESSHWATALTFSEWDAYRDKTLPADFNIPKDFEPFYDLYLSNKEDKCHTSCKVWNNISMNEVLEHLVDYNKNYILKPTCPTSTNVYREAERHGTNVICYDMTRRSK